MPESKKVPNPGAIANIPDETMLSSVEVYTQRLEKTLDHVLVELRGCETYDQLAQKTRNALLWSVSGGSKEVTQCNPEMIASIYDKLSKIQVALTNDASVVYRLMIKNNLQKFIDDLKK